MFRTFLRHTKRAIGFSYLTLSIIPLSFTVASIATIQDRPKSRAYAFWAWTGWLSLPFSVILFLAAPYSLLFDPHDRLALDWVQRRWSTLCLKPFLEIEVENKNAARDLLTKSGKGCVVVSNHQSVLDVFVLFTALGIPLRFVSKREIFYIPLVGWVMSLIGHIALVRGDRESGKSVLLNCKKKLEEGNAWSVVFFSEGSRLKAASTTDLGEFKIGAFSLSTMTRLPLLPVTIIGTRDVMPPGKEFSCFSDQYQKVIVKILEPIPSQNKSIDVLKQECWRSIKDGLSIQKT